MEFTCHVPADALHGAQFSLFGDRVCRLSEPVLVKGVLGKQFKKDAKKVTDALMALSPEQLTEMESQLNDAG